MLEDDCTIHFHRVFSHNFFPPAPEGTIFSIDLHHFRFGRFRSSQFHIPPSHRADKIFMKFYLMAQVGRYSPHPSETHQRTFRHAS
jgi:hypothetical protein